MIRIWKNIRIDLIESNRIDEKLVCSYFIENLLYCCPNDLFENEKYSVVSIQILRFIHMNINDDSIVKFICANTQDFLFSIWDVNKCKIFLKELEKEIKKRLHLEKEGV